MAYSIPSKISGQIVAILCLSFIGCNTKIVNTAGKTNTNAPLNSDASKNKNSSSGGYSGGDGGFSTSANSDSGNTASVETEGEVCATANIVATVSRVTPTVIFVVDRSAPMSKEYPGSSSRWQAIHDALLMDKTGVVTRLQSVVRFGMVLFDAPLAEGVANVVADTASGITDLVLCAMGQPESCPAIDGGDTAADNNCPRLITVNPALNNYSAIYASYKEPEAGSLSPTALSLYAAYAFIQENWKKLPDRTPKEPALVVLCTDGLPNSCVNQLGLPDQQGPIDRVTDAAKNGITTYVISVAADADAQSYLEQLAMHGNTNHGAFTPATTDELVRALSDIVSGSVGCNVTLNGNVTSGKEWLGTVTLNGQPLTFSGPDGWVLVNESEIQLQGSACDQFKFNATSELIASFPCGTFVLW
jgi:hypothetical protein